MATHVLLYVPNVIGYLRLLFLLVSWLFIDANHMLSLAFYALSISLDALDGYAARTLDQVSAFGAWFDIVIDNTGRGMLWSKWHHLGYLVAAVEWLTFVCTHSTGSQWKEKMGKRPPLYVTRVMANNFRTLPGFIAIGSLQVLPMWLYAYQTGILSFLHMPLLMQHGCICLLAAGRSLAFAVEVWCILTHIEFLLSHNDKQTQISTNTSRNTDENAK